MRNQPRKYFLLIIFLSSITSSWLLGSTIPVLKFKKMSMRKMLSEIPLRTSQCRERSSLKNEMLTGRRITCMEIKAIRRISQYHRNVLNGCITPLPFCSCRRCSMRTAALFPNSFKAILLSGLAAKMSLRYVKAFPPFWVIASVDCRLACFVKVSTVDCWSWEGRPRASPGSSLPWRPANRNVFKYHKNSWFRLSLVLKKASTVY